VATRIEIAGGEGVSLSAQYPEGEKFGTDEIEIMVYRGTVDIVISLRADSEITGNPKLLLTYQPCTDRACLAPVQKVLGISISGK
ncbi:MAG TPA: hypothetical protein ENJ06_02735, partial [Phycisphaeraceae bacterium]|nr:hypothetical protein [Phycisphaeraceae bacterium]